jgi:hypothetical protein
MFFIMKTTPGTSCSLTSDSVFFINGRTLLFLFFILLFSSFKLNAQVATAYTWSRVTTPAHAAMAGGTVLASGTAMDDAVYTNIPIGFACNYNGIDYTTVGVSTNGFIWFGTTNPATNDYTPISSATAMTGVISCYGANLVGRTATANLKYITTGTCPNRTFMVQWFNMKVVGKTSQLDLQITLTEGTNMIDIHVYDAPYFVGDTHFGQVGIRGASNADFSNRSVVSCSNTWNPSVAGATNTATCQIDGVTCSTYPAANNRYRYTCNATAGTNTWTGATSSDWFTASNWSLAKVPTTYHNIVIPAALGTYPVLTGSTNTFFKTLNIGTGATLTTAVGYTGVVTVNGSVTNNGTIVNNGTAYFTLNGSTGSTISGTGDFSQADFSLSGPCANYSLSNNILVRKLTITTTATLNMNAFDLLVLTSFIQVGTINQSTGTLQIEDPAPTLTNATFTEGTGTTYFSIGTTTTPGNQLIPSITYYNLTVNTNNGYTATIGNGTAVSCNNLIIKNPAASGGIASVANAITVTKNFDLAPTGNTPTVNLNANVSVGSTGITTLYLGVINTGANRVIINNNLAGAVAAGAGNTDYTLSYINGNLRRFIASGAGGNYDFPLGDAGSSRYAILKDGALSGGGFTYLDAYFGALVNHTDADMMAVPVGETTEPGVYYGHICVEGVWFLDPDFQPTAGSYILVTYINNIAGLSDDNFAILKRSSSSLSGADWTDGGGVRPASMLAGRTIASGYALRDGLTTFSQFGIATDPAIVLPVSLLSLEAKKKGKENIVEWITAMETNNHHFTIERSADAIDFSEIGLVPGAGNSNYSIKYSETDESPLTAISYYRLKQTDFNGASVYSKIVSVARNETDFELINAFHVEGLDVLELTLNCSDKCITSLELYDLMGAKIYTSIENINGNYTKVLIPLADLSPGIYFITVFNGDKRITRKIKW